MTIVTVTDDLQTVLGDLKDRAELRDGQGNLLGYFTPPEVEEEEFYQWAIKQFDLKEMRRRLETEKERHTTEEVLAHLKSLEKP